MAVGLQLAGKNDFVKVQENINNNLTKLDEAIDFNLLATLGIEYGGILNNTNAKTSGKAYYDTTGKKLYKCIANTSINYADAGFFEALSNNDLLGRLNNLFSGMWYYNSLVQEIDLNVLEGELFFVYLHGQVKATGTTHNYVGSSAFIVRKNDLERKFNLQVQGSGPSYKVGVIFRNNKLVADLSGDTLYGIAGQIVRIF